MVTNAGEDVIFICDACKMAINKEIKADQPNCPSCGVSELREAKSIEVGNIFELKTKYSGAFDLSYKDEEGNPQPIQMGCYGIGLGRLMGSVVELLSDEQGIVWPEAIAPFAYHLVNLAPDDFEVSKEASALYEELSAKGIEVLYDDRLGVTAGAKFADSDLLGIPTRIVISKKTIAAGKLEIKHRKSGTVEHYSKEALLLHLVK